MKKTLQRGFTLIELLVVIAIIGILAAVVLASLNDARSGGQNASIQQTMASVRTQAEVYFNGPGGFAYSGLCSDTDMLDLINAAVDVVNGATYTAADGTQATNSATDETARKAQCAANASAYQVTTPLAGGSGFWCLDSTGQVGTASTSPANDAVSCS